MATSDLDPRKVYNVLTYNATEDGLKRLEDDANRAHKLGYRLVSTIPLLPKQVGAVFVRRAATGGGSLVDDDGWG